MERLKWNEKNSNFCHHNDIPLLTIRVDIFNAVWLLGVTTLHSYKPSCISCRSFEMWNLSVPLARRLPSLYHSIFVQGNGLEAQNLHSRSIGVFSCATYINLGDKKWIGISPGKKVKIYVKIYVSNVYRRWGSKRFFTKHTANWLTQYQSLVIEVETLYGHG